MTALPGSLFEVFASEEHQVIKDRVKRDGGLMNGGMHTKGTDPSSHPRA